VTDKLQKQLFKKYPKIFRQKNLPMTQTAMCWGLDCGDGWYWLLDRLCCYLQFQTDKNHMPQVEATQVKEKFGTLRFYYAGGDARAEHVIDYVEYLSSEVCETCGSTSDVSQTQGGYVQTLCSLCQIVREL